MTTLYETAREQNTTEREIIRKAYHEYHGICDDACIQAEYDKIKSGGHLPHYVISYLTFFGRR